MAAAEATEVPGKRAGDSGEQRRYARGAVSVAAPRPRTRHEQHRPSPAPARLPRRRGGAGVPGAGHPVPAIENLESAFVIGSHPRSEVPILAHRLRKAAAGRAGEVPEPARFTHLFAVKSYLGRRRDQGAPCRSSRRGAQATGKTGAGAPCRHRQRRQRDGRDGASPGAARGASGRSGWAHLALRHRALCRPALVGRRPGRHSPEPRSGASPRAATRPARTWPGAIPHREAGDVAVTSPGLNVREMLAKPLRAYLLVGGLEPSIDAQDPESVRTLAKAELVVAITRFASAEIKAIAHVLLPSAALRRLPALT